MSATDTETTVMDVEAESKRRVSGRAMGVLLGVGGGRVGAHPAASGDPNGVREKARASEWYGHAPGVAAAASEWSGRGRRTSVQAFAAGLIV